MKTLTITGRRWFQRSYGNTYCSATVHLDGELIATVPETYGYGDYYRQAAMEAVDATGWLPPRKQYANGSYEGTRQWAERNNISVVSNVSDVARERDL